MDPEMAVLPSLTISAGTLFQFGFIGIAWRLQVAPIAVLTPWKLAGALS